MTYDPNSTQELKRRSSDVGKTDRHRLNDLLWSAIENHDNAIKSFAERLTRIETSINGLKWLIGTAIAFTAVWEGFHK